MKKLAIIGSGASAIYLLKRLADRPQLLRRRIAEIAVFEKSGITGMGMPYNPRTTDRHNMSNISSDELPGLETPFAIWLGTLGDAELAEFGIDRESIDGGEVYCRLALGGYFRSQYLAIIERIRDAGTEVRELPDSEVTDIRFDAASGMSSLVTTSGEFGGFARVVIATGHVWDDGDRPGEGYYGSPWPIFKLLPEDGKFHNFRIGTLGASLSAFDVISSLAHRHGEFVEAGSGLGYRPHPGTEDFELTMHSGEGLLPHLQFDQLEPFREIYRHVGRDRLLALRDESGFLRLGAYFDGVCRPALIRAFTEDGRDDLVASLGRSDFGLEELIARLTDEHDYVDAFEGMRGEMPEALESVCEHKPIRWKEVIDDLMFTLNFHAELLAAEDHLQLRSLVMPFLMNVIAAMPLGSARILLALHEAGKISLVGGKVSVEGGSAGTTRIRVDDGGGESGMEYRMFVDCSGQKPLELEDFPFSSLVESGTVRAARAAFSEPAGPGEDAEKHLFYEDGKPYLRTGGIDIDGYYRVIGADGRANLHIHDVALPHISGPRPYSYGLQACAAACALVVEAWDAEAEDGPIEVVSDGYETMGAEGEGGLSGPPT